MVFFCQFCSFSSFEWKKLLRHTFEAHSNIPGFLFTCGLDGCPQTFQTSSGITSHLRRKHRGRDFDNQSITSMSNCSVLPAVIPEETSNDDQIGQDPEIQLGTPDVDQLQKAAALFLLCLKERYQITQTAVDFAVGQVQLMLSYGVEDIRNTVEMRLRSHSLEASAVSDIMESINIIDPFMCLRSEYMQTKYYKENFDLIVS